MSINWNGQGWDILNYRFGLNSKFTSKIVWYNCTASFTYTGYRYVKNQCCTLHFLHPCTGYTYIRYICVPDTGPINPHGFLAPFCHLIVYYTDTIIWTWTWKWGSWHLCIAVMYQHHLLHVIVTCSFACMVCLIQVSCNYMLNDEHSVVPNGK